MLVLVLVALLVALLLVLVLVPVLVLVLRLGLGLGPVRWLEQEGGVLVPVLVLAQPNLPMPSRRSEISPLGSTSSRMLCQGLLTVTPMLPPMLTPMLKHWCRSSGRSTPRVCMVGFGMSPRLYGGG